MICWVAFDADDTLWENEIYYQRAQDALSLVLQAYCQPEQVAAALLQTETQNIPAFGYGIKSFGLSMIETAIRLSGGKIPANEIHALLELLKQMATSAPEVLPAVEETLRALSRDYRLMVITKGDLLDQERKLASSGLAAYFEHFEVVHTKDPNSYQRILNRLGIAVNEFTMVGNSLRSDVLPVTALGAAAVLIPHMHTWEHEKIVNGELEHQPYYELTSINALPALLVEINHE